MKIVYIAHPIGGAVQDNLAKIRDIVRQLNLTRTDIVPFCPYYLDCLVLDDDDNEQRMRGVRNDVELIQRKFIDECWLYGPRISAGMEAEVRLFRSLDIPVVPMSEGTKEEYSKLIPDKV